MAGERVTITGSERSAPAGATPAGLDADTRVQVSVYLKRPEPVVVSGAPRARATIRAEREQSLAPGLKRIAAFAADQALDVVEQDAARRLVKLEGRLEDVRRAFGATLHAVDVGGTLLRARSGVLSTPPEVAADIEAVLGLDQRPAATPKSQRLRAAGPTSGHPPNAVTAIYGFPAAADTGAGQCIAIIELGGGVSPSDTDTAFAAMGLKPPTVSAVLVGAGTNQPGKDTNADGEVALDVQVAGAAAPSAALAVYFAPNTDQGFVDAITQAAHDATRRPSVMSISWGSAESAWTQQAVNAMTSAFQDAAEIGVSVFAASGDGLATDGVGDGRAHVDFPASCPWVVGCGGTRLAAGADPLAGESVWNSDGGGTGGGVSTLFAPPAYQASITTPAETSKGHRTPGGRGAPDVAGNADPNTGYRVVVDGKVEVIGGTSAVAPLWSGLFAAINATRSRPVGQPHPTLYAHPEVFNDIVRGDNKVGAVGYVAGPGWDACTGLGSPKGAALAALFGAT